MILKPDGKTPVYAVILTDPAGDAHLRLVNAETGALTVRSLWKAPVPQKSKNQNSGGRFAKHPNYRYQHRHEKR